MLPIVMLYHIVLPGEVFITVSVLTWDGCYFVDAILVPGKIRSSRKTGQTIVGVTEETSGYGSQPLSQY